MKKMFEFEEEPVWYPIYSDEFKKSTLLTELDEEQEEEFDQYGRKKRRGYNLKDLEIAEISLCRAGKVNTKYYVKKGENNMSDTNKKKLDKSTPKWETAQRQIFGYSEQDLEDLDLDEEDLEIEKSSDDNPFPSISRIINNNIRNVEEFIESENIESRFV